ncbi:MAG: AAA family ATPase [Candidatus Acidiferrales bacterium]
MSARLLQSGYPNSHSLPGRRAELHRLVAAFRAREPLLVHGPAGSGKTALLHAAVARLNALERIRVLDPRPSATPGALAAELLRLLEATCNPIAAAALAAKNRPSARRQGAILIDALSASPYWLVLDHFPCFTQPTARLLKHILARTGTPIYVAARGITRSELGANLSLYWCAKLRLELAPLAPSSASELVNRETRGLDLPASELADFRASVLRVSARLPGAILQLCALAKQPSYRSHARLKTALLQIDARISTYRGAAIGSPAMRFGAPAAAAGEIE